MFNEDIVLAQKIVGNSVSNVTKNIYHNNSFIYATTNEKIKQYQEFLNSRKSILSVISSGDQILNTILGGSTNVDGFDISRFPKYFMELKRASVISLDLKQFIEFFFCVNYEDNEKYDDLYFDKIRLSLDEEYRKFWDSLFNFYDWYDIFNSTLFSSQNFSLDSIIQNNAYLEPTQYQELKKLLSVTNITYYTDDIFNLVDKLKKDYDFINLSSIMYYVKNYSELLSKLNLERDGIALTYLYTVKEEIKLGYPNFQIIQFENSKEGIMLYRKR